MYTVTGPEGKEQWYGQVMMGLLVVVDKVVGVAVIVEGRTIVGVLVGTKVLVL